MHISDSFYAALPGFDAFNQLGDSRHYTAVPDNYWVVVADVRGSTQAVLDGKYKDVNMVGAATITALINQLQIDFPFVFGGDGATAIIPDSCREQAIPVLRSLIQYSAELFNLTVSAGLVPVADIRRAGLEIEVAKYAPRQRMPLALFRGGGLAMAEQLLKSTAAYQLEPAALIPRDLIFAGLTCRWQQMPARKGTTATVMIAPTGQENASAIHDLIDAIEQILGGSYEAANPVNLELTGYRSLLNALRYERGFHDHWYSRAFFQRLTELLIAIPLFKWGLYKHFDWASHYVNAISRHVDFQKFDDTIRMVIDCDPQQVLAIESLLQTQHAAGLITYGLHTSSAAQMTCYVEGLQDNQHIHFIDGSDGGYTLAAADFKRRLADSAPSDTPTCPA